MQNRIEKLFTFLVLASLFAPFILFKALPFPYISSKAFYFRVVIEAALPFYLYLLASRSEYRPKLTNPITLFVSSFFVLSLFSSFLGIEPVRSLWGNFERMGGVFYLLHLSLLYLYVLALSKMPAFAKEWKNSIPSLLILIAALAGFLKFGGLSVLISILISLSIAALVFIFAWKNITPLRAFLELLVFLATATVINGIFNKLGIVLLYLDASLPTRVSSTFGNPIFFASFLILPLSLSIYLAFLEKKTWKKIYYYVSIFLAAVGIYQSGTRGALVGLLVGLVLMGGWYLFNYKKDSKRKRNFALGFTVLLGLLILGFAFSKQLPQGNLRRVFNLNDVNTQSRLIQWRVALTGFKDHPFLGTGPENYYVIADKYYNPAIYQYDASWFDKPHNYFLEVLTTTGIVGTLAFLGMLIFVLFALFKALKAGTISLEGFCALSAGFIAYNIQNLFVFDTVSASIVFFASVGFASVLGFENFSEDFGLQKASPNFFATGLMGLSLVGIAIVMYVGNFMPMKIGQNVQYGNAYTSVDYKKAAEYFKTAISLPYNFDEVETAGRYVEYAAALAQGGVAASDPNFVKEQLAQSFDYQKIVANKHPHHPIAWLHLASVKILDDMVNNRTLDEKDEEYIYKALDLAPKKVELMQLLLQLRGYQKDWKRGAEVAAKIVSLNPYNPQLRLQSGVAEYLAGNKEQGALLAYEAIKQGYKPKSAQEIFWSGSYYFQQKNYSKAIPILEAVIGVEPGNLDAFFMQAQSYAKIGEKEKAKLMAEMIVKLDPTKKEAVNEFLQSLK